VLGAVPAIVYPNDKSRRYVAPLTRELKVSICEPLDVQIPRQLEAVRERVHEDRGRLDRALHSMTCAPQDVRQGGVLRSSAGGSAIAMGDPAHSFIRMARPAAPLMESGGLDSCNE
jgi:enoyl-[acyl-carrier protein] reductase I